MSLMFVLAVLLQETSGASGHQKLRVCDICGAYLSILDSDRRLADHFGGKVRGREAIAKDHLLSADLQAFHRLTVKLFDII